jgi:hypothetical protein
LDEFTIRGCTCGLNLLSVLLTFIQWYPAITPLQLWENFNLTFCKAYIWIVFHEKMNCVIEVLTTLSIDNFFFSFFNNIEISAAVVYF